MTDYTNLVDRTTNKEMRLNESQKRRDRWNQLGQQRGSQSKGLNNKGPQTQRNFNDANKGEQKGVDSPSFQKNFPHCSRCGRLYQGECYMNIGACFNCVQIGNMVKDCPKRHENTGSAQVEEDLRKKRIAKGRVFVMMEQDTEASNDVVTNTLSLFSRYAKVLFDFGATHSFISIAFAYHANRNIEPLDCYLTVATPMGDNMIVNQVYKSV